ALEEFHNSPSHSPQHSDDAYIALIKSNGVTSEYDAMGILNFWNNHGSAFVAYSLIFNQQRGQI
uniref:hypothetical protein n=1 Tax=Streptobacillus moniliformis TaxID=34105 RepID=UPI001E3DAD62